MKKIHDKGYEVLYFLDERDEFAAGIMMQYDEKPFQSVNKSDLDLDTEEEKKAKEEKTEENKDMLTAMKEALGDKVKEVRISSRLSEDPVCIVSDEGVSLEMEKFLANDPMNRGVKATKILEINPDHPIFTTLQKMYEKDPESIKDYTDVLYNQALLIQGLSIEDPASYAKKIADLMVKAAEL